MNDTAERDRFLQDVIDGLSRPQPQIASKYFYDELGSALFEAISVTPEYYVTRCDLDLHQRHAADIARFLGDRVHLIEFGTGAGTKTSLLLEALDCPRAYTPIEISDATLQAAAASLRCRFPEIRIHPLQADYTQPLERRAVDICPDCRHRVVYFPGSTIGNFEHAEAAGFLRRIRALCAAAHDGVRAGLLIGFDLLKPPEIMLPAYSDAAGVTAAFNKNLLARINRELGADFALCRWRHEARFNAGLERMESYLVSTCDQQISIAGRRFDFPEGSSIHTENSHKYTLEGFKDMAAAAGFRLEQHWLDGRGWFVMAYFGIDTIPGG